MGFKEFRVSRYPFRTHQGLETSTSKMLRLAPEGVEQKALSTERCSAELTFSLGSLNPVLHDSLARPAALDETSLHPTVRQSSLRRNPPDYSAFIPYLR